MRNKSDEFEINICHLVKCKINLFFKGDILLKK